MTMWYILNITKLPLTISNRGFVMLGIPPAMGWFTNVPAMEGITKKAFCPLRSISPLRVICVTFVFGCLWDLWKMSPWYHLSQDFLALQNQEFVGKMDEPRNLGYRPHGWIPHFPTDPTAVSDGVRWRSAVGKDFSPGGLSIFRPTRGTKSATVWLGLFLMMLDDAWWLDDFGHVWFLRFASWLHLDLKFTLKAAACSGPNVMSL